MEKAINMNIDVKLWKKLKMKAVKEETTIKALLEKMIRDLK